MNQYNAFFSDQLPSPLFAPPQTYETVTLELDVETLVSTLLFCSMSIVFALPGPTLPLAVFADAPVNVTVPKFANGTSELPSSKSSTIHSASCSHSALRDVICFVTVLPLELFVMTAVPALVDVAVTVRVTESPGEKVMPETS